MNEWLASGLVVDIILLALVLEAGLLALLGRVRRLGITIWLPNLAAGAALLVALRLAIADAAWTWVAAALGLALLAHVIDLRLRFEPQR